MNVRGVPLIRPGIAVALSLVVLVAAGSLAVGAEPARPEYRVGLLRPSLPEFVVGDGMRTWLEWIGSRGRGRVVCDVRYPTRGDHELPGLARELVALGSDVLVAEGTAATLAARRATTTVPIVMVIRGDPVAAALVDNLDRPGGNVTGVSCPNVMRSFMA